MLPSTPPRPPSTPTTDTTTTTQEFRRQRLNARGMAHQRSTVHIYDEDMEEELRIRRESARGMAHIRSRSREEEQCVHDDGCDLDVELIEFVVGSFIKMFPQDRREGRRRFAHVRPNDSNSSYRGGKYMYLYFYGSLQVDAMKNSSSSLILYLTSLY